MPSKKHHDSNQDHPEDEQLRSDVQQPESEDSRQATDLPAEDALMNMQQQIDQLTEALQRERADATNIRRRHEEQMGGVRTIVKANVVRDLLPVIDNLERALKHVPDELKDNDYVKGVQGVVKQFEKTLNGIGVSRIKTVGEPFDPTYHEAVAMEEGDGTEEIVSEELQAGYQVGDEVIRHAMVRVSLR
jgi:molecular chaperone GrpE